jgi:hypothetical protein
MSERDIRHVSLALFLCASDSACLACERVCLFGSTLFFIGWIVAHSAQRKVSPFPLYEKGTKQRKVSLYPFPFFSSSGAAQLYTARFKLYGTATPSCDAWRHASVVAGAVGAATVPASPSTSGARLVDQAPRTPLRNRTPALPALVRSRKQRAAGGARRAMRRVCERHRRPCVTSATGPRPDVTAVPTPSTPLGVALTHTA